jgi:hypothetical protein
MIIKSLGSIVHRVPSVAVYASMDDRPRPKSLLLDMTPIDSPDRPDTLWSEYAAALRAATAHAADSDVPSILVARASADDNAHAAVAFGLLYSILTDVDEAPQTFQWLSAVIRDDFKSVVDGLVEFLKDNSQHILPGSWAQIIWLCRHIVEANVRIPRLFLREPLFRCRCHFCLFVVVAHSRRYRSLRRSARPLCGMSQGAATLILISGSLKVS